MRLHRDPIRGGTRTKRAVAMLLLTKPKTELRYSYSFTCYSVRRGKRGKRGSCSVRRTKTPTTQDLSLSL